VNLDFSFNGLQIRGRESAPLCLHDGEHAESHPSALRLMCSTFPPICPVLEIWRCGGGWGGDTGCHAVGQVQGIWPWPEDSGRSWV